jgi:uroporphyrinogen decarboxylase
MTSELTSKERILYAIEGREVDRTPVFPTVHHNSTRVAGETIKNYASNADVMAHCLLTAFKRYGYDGIEVGVDAIIEAEALGSEAYQPENEPPYVTKPFLQRKKDLGKLTHIADPQTRGRMPVVIGATKRIKETVKDMVYIQSIVMGPMNIASQLRGVETLVFDIMDDPLFVNELLDFTLRQSLEYGKALLDAGATGLDIGEAFCSLNMISPNIYREFALPRHRALIKGLKEYGGFAELHICGNVTEILDDMEKTGADFFDIDWQVDMKTATNFNTCRGNLDPSEVLLKGNRDIVLEKSRRVLSSASHTNRVILGSGCEIAPNTPEENIAAMVDAVERFSVNAQ